MPHQGRSELLERVTEDDHLRAFAKFVQKRAGARHRLQAGDHVADRAHQQSVFGQQREAALHQDVVVRLVAGGPAEGLDTGSFGDGNPDLWYQYALQIEGDDGLLSGGGSFGNVVHGGLFFTTADRREKRQRERRAL